MTWPPLVGLRADAGGGRVLQGGVLILLMMEPRGLTQAAGASCEAASLSMATWPRGLTQAACGEAGSVTVAGD